MRKLFLIFLLFPLISFSQHIGGRFSYGIHPDSGRTGSLDIYQESDTSLIFNLDLCRGAPSYNLGSQIGRIIKDNNQWIYYVNDDFLNCKLEFIIFRDIIEIKTMEGFGNCGYGGGVYSDGSYKRYESGNPEYYLLPPYYEKKWFKDYNY